MTQLEEQEIGESKIVPVDMKLEVAVIPVSDVDRAKEFYGRLGWRLDADFRFDNGFRVVQFTPPGSGASIQFGTNVTPVAPGSAQSLYLVVSAIAAAYSGNRRYAEPLIRDLTLINLYLQRRLSKPRSACNPNVARRHNEEFSGRQLVSVILQCLIQMLDLGLQLGPGKPEKQDAGLRHSLIEDQLAEIAVGNDQDPLLSPGNRQDVLIRKAMRVIPGDGCNVVAEGSKVVDKAELQHCAPNPH